MRSLLSLSILTLSSIFVVSAFSQDHFRSDLKKRLTVEQFMNDKFLIYLESSNPEVNSNVCDSMGIVLKNIYGRTQGQCVYSDNLNDSKKLTNKALANKHSFIVTLNDDGVGKYKIIAKYLQGDEFDIQELTWNLKSTDDKKLSKAVKEITFKLVDYEKNSHSYRDILFYKGIAQSQSIRAIDEYRFIDTKTKTSMDKETAFTRFSQEKKANKNYLKAGLELGALLGIGQALYFANHDAMAEDQEYTNKSFSDFKNRMFTLDQSGFDDNAISMNWGHSYAGMLYYQAARNNAFSSKESFLVTLAASTIWEVFGEHREILSLNDQITTSVGGSIIGEVGYQISNMLKRRSGLSAKIVSAIVNPMGAINNWVSGKNMDAGHRNFSREYGFNGDNYEDINIVTGLTYLNNKETAQTKTLVELGLEAEVINLPIEGEGRISSVIYDPMMAKLSINTHISTDHIEDFHSVTKLVLAGYFNKNIIRDTNGKLKGHSFYIGAASKTEYRSRGEGHGDDFFAVVNVLGGTLDVHYFVNGIKMRFAIDMYGDFAMVRPYAVDAYQEDGGTLWGGNTVLQRKNYYYGRGITNGLNFSIEKDKWKAGLDAVNHYFESINSVSLDRTSEAITRKLDMKDKYTSIKFYVSYEVTKSSKVVMGLERIIREGTLHNRTDEIKSSAESKEDRFYLNYEHKI